MLGSPQQTQAPDLIDPVKGWRSWNLVRSYGRWLLESPDLKAVWAPGQAVYAHCTQAHDAQEQRERCNCGINAFESQNLLVQSGYGERAVIGEVDLWGEVTKYDSGWRGQWAKPAALIVQMEPGELALQVALDLETAYGVEVIVRRPGETAEAARQDAPARPAATPAPAPAVMDEQEARWRIAAVRCVGALSLLVVFACVPRAIAIRREGPDRLQQLRDADLVTSHASDDSAHFFAALGMPMLMAMAVGIAMLIILRLGHARLVNEQAVHRTGAVAAPPRLLGVVDNWASGLTAVLAVPFFCCLGIAMSLTGSSPIDIDSVQQARLVAGKPLVLDGAKDDELGDSLARISADVKLKDGTCKVAMAPVDENGGDLRVKICRDKAKLTFKIP